jgi:hypothetical protein
LARWILISILAVVVVSTLAEDEAEMTLDDMVEQDVAAAAETIATETVPQEPIVEAVPEPPRKEEEVKTEPVQQQQEPEKQKTVPAETKPKSSTTPLKVLQSKLDCVVDKSKQLVERAKNISKNDAKKIAAAGLAIWGASVGIGWLTTQGTTATAAKVVQATTKK